MKITFIFFCFAISLCSLGQNVRDESSTAQYLPSLLIDGRFFLKMPTLNNDTVIGFCDTGGGYTAIYYKTLQKLKLESKISQVDINGDKTSFIFAKDLFDSNKVPYPTIGNYYKSHIDYPFFEIPDTSERMDLFSKYVHHDVFLGQHFFMGKAWTFDYLKEEIWVNTPIHENKRNRKNIQNLGFKKNAEGRKLFGHPSMEVEIDGDTLDVLFDTGASFILSDSGQVKLETSQLSIAGSFIAKSIYTKWRSRHPDWKVFEKSDMNADIIEVPEIKIGTYAVGPVLFSVRPDESWSKNMINSMDKIVKGAIGGSGLGYFEIKVDYNKELIEFSKH